jgi:hypothetical protein
MSDVDDFESDGAAAGQNTNAPPSAPDVDGLLTGSRHCLAGPAGRCATGSGADGCGRCGSVAAFFIGPMTSKPSLSVETHACRQHRQARQINAFQPCRENGHDPTFFTTFCAVTPAHLAPSRMRPLLRKCRA